ncbi:hypothetical protein M0802_000213 [Mischocyttarus mexicanus]|nr:hypothetical protein M0802_000213 [Mischocyttarus mexicanus]
MAVMVVVVVVVLVPSDGCMVAMVVVVVMMVVEGRVRMTRFATKAHAAPLVEQRESILISDFDNCLPD